MLDLVTLTVWYNRGMLPERIEKKIKRTDSCWKWVAGKYQAGYGTIWWGGKVQISHRVVYELLVGPITEGLEIDHLCRNRACVNPQHLEAVTHAENVRRGDNGKPMREMSKKRKFCKRMHKLTPDNVYLYIQPRTGFRFKNCVECGRIRGKNYRLSHPKPKKVHIRPTHCPQGHHYSPENLGTTYNKRESRTQYYCRVCRRASSNRWKQAHKPTKV